MRDKWLFSDAQGRTNPDSTGTISTHIFDLEQTSGGSTIITDDQLNFVCNVILTAVSYTSGGTEGILLAVRTDDATDLATAKDGSSAGYIVIGSQEVPLERIVAGAKFSIPCHLGIAKRYVGGWLSAVSTTYTGTITVDMWVDYEKVTENDAIQKVPSRS